MDWITALITIGGTLLTIGGTLVSVWLGTRLAQGASRQEKLVDLRRLAYGPILAELTEVERRLEGIDDTITMHGSNTYFQGSGEAAKLREADDDFVGARMAAVRKLYSEHYLVLSSAFVKRYEGMTTEFGKGHDELPPDAHEIFARAIRAARSDLLGIALREVGQGRTWWQAITGKVSG